MTKPIITRLSTNPEGFGQTPDELEAGMFAEEPKAQHTHSAFEDESLGLYVGLWDTTDMIESGGPYTCDEFMFLIEGEAVIRNNRTGEMQKATAGQAFLIPKGYDCQWQQQGYLRKFFFISEHPDEAIPELPAHEGIIIPEEVGVAYRDHTGRFSAGIWNSDTFPSGPGPFPGHCLVIVQAGGVVLTDESGDQHEFQAGEAFFVEHGAICRAETNQETLLHYASLAN